MPRDFYPRREADIVRWTSNFSNRINSAAEDFGIPPQRAAEYAVVQQAFVAAYNAFQNPGTDSTTAFSRKEAGRVALEAATRPLVKVVKGTRTVTDEMWISLGLKPRGVRRREVPVPAAAPILRVVGMSGNVFSIRLEDAEVARRGKPRDVQGAVIFGHAGDEPPATRGGWAFMGGTSRATAKVRFDPKLPPGTKVWLTARWHNLRAEPGPACTPVSAHLPFDAVGQFDRRARAA